MPARASEVATSALRAALGSWIVNELAPARAPSRLPETSSTASAIAVVVSSSSRPARRAAAIVAPKIPKIGLERNPRACTAGIQSPASRAWTSYPVARARIRSSPERSFGLGRGERGRDDARPWVGEHLVHVEAGAAVDQLGAGERRPTARHQRAVAEDAGAVRDAALLILDQRQRCRARPDGSARPRRWSGPGA